MQIKTDHLHDLPRNGPTHHLRMFPTTLTIQTGHNLNNNTGSNNPPMFNSSIRTRLWDRYQNPDQSLPSKTVPRTSVPVEMSMYPVNSLDKTHGNSLLFLFNLQTKICKRRLPGSGPSWN